MWGPKHGGANQAVIEMLEGIYKDGRDYKKYIDLAKDKQSEFRLRAWSPSI